MAASLLLLVVLPFGLLPTPRPPTQRVATISQGETWLRHALPHFQPAPPPRATVAHAVQRLAVSDASRCWGELCDLEGDTAQDCLFGGVVKLEMWMKSREPILRWATNLWVQHHLLPVLPAGAKARMPQQSQELTLFGALAPIGPWQLTRVAFRTSPRKVVAVLAQFAQMWVSRLLLPAEVARQRRRRALAPTLMELAAAYDALR